MAVINLGAIKFNWKGAYNNSTAYAVDDVVSSGGNSYVCIQASQGNAVGNATAYWNIMSSVGAAGAEGGTTTLTTRGDLLYKGASAVARLAKGTAGQVLGQGANDPAWVNGSSSTLTTQGDLLYRDGSGLQRLAKGTAAKVLAMNSAANAPEWVDASGGAWEKLGEVEHTGSSVSTVDINFTPNDSVYKWYKLYIQDWRGNGGNFKWRVKTGGSTVTSNIYTTGGSGTANTGSAIWHDQRNNDTNSSSMHLDQTWTAFTSADYGSAYEINFYKGSSSNKKSFFWTHLINHNAADYVGAGYMGGMAATSSALTGFNLFLSSGSITHINAYILGFKA